MGCGALFEAWDSISEYFEQVLLLPLFNKPPDDLGDLLKAKYEYFSIVRH
jgi:hypothetical protein